MGQLTPHATSVLGFPKHLVILFLTCLPLQDCMRSPQVLSITIFHHSDHNHTNDSLAFMPCLNHFSNVLGIGLPRASGGSPIVVPPLVHFCSGLMAHLQPLHTSYRCDMLATSNEALELLTHLRLLYCYR